MKNIKYVLIMFVAVMVSVSCNNDDDDIDGANSLVGTWGFTEMENGEEISVTVTFKANYTGTTVVVVTFDGESETESVGFTWDTDGNKLTMEGDGKTDITTYSISGDKLTINYGEGGTLVLTRQ